MFNKDVALTPAALELETNFAHVIRQQEKIGFKFDVLAAVELYSKLSKLRDETKDEKFKGVLDHRISLIAEGENSWLMLEKNGRIHGSVDTCGTITGRCTHSKPNVAGVPTVRTIYGTECRSLFTVPPGFKLVGVDACGLELRCLAHYLYRYDGGAYARIIEHGDVHWTNALAFGLVASGTAYDHTLDEHQRLRALCKELTYAMLYGAGYELLGELMGGDSETGRTLKQNFIKNIKGFSQLLSDVKRAASSRGFLIALDGRHIEIRSSHSALNFLLQSAGAILVKQATVYLYQALTGAGYKFGIDWAMVAHCHDEFQLQVRQGLVSEVETIAVQAFSKAGEYFKCRCPIDGEAKVGNNWAETH